MLYWMRTALRGHENPALDVARAVAGGQGLPLLVAAFVLRSHTYPTERRYQFTLQGLHDTQLELREQVATPASRTRSSSGVSTTSRLRTRSLSVVQVRVGGLQSGVQTCEDRCM